MWKLLEQAAKTATANASEYVSSVQEKAQSLAATVQEEAATLLHAIGSARTGPVDELLYEEVDDYKAFCDTFKIDTHTDEISKILEEDDEIRGLHEQMVPVQLSYEEFWSRYFFRREQEELREQREAERRRKQEEAKAQSKVVLEEFEVDDDDEEEFDATTARAHVGDDMRDDLDDSSLHENVKDEADKDEGAATLAQLKEIRASRKAAAQWKQKAIEYQKQLGVLAARQEDEKQKLQESMESQCQSLCETYESKMTEMTMQIDEARAIGYNEGIQESEAIVATMREEADSQINRLKLEIAQLQQEGTVASENHTEASTAELHRLRDALALKEEVVKALEEQKTQLEVTLREKEETLNKTQTELAQARESASSSSIGGIEEAKKETELWKVRAIKMKKLKEQIEAEFHQFKERHSVASADVNDIEALQPKIADLTRQNEILSAQVTEAYAKGALHAQAQLDEVSSKLKAAQEKLETVGKNEFDRGYEMARKEVESQLEGLRDQVGKATKEGEAKASAALQAEIDSLKAELASLRAERQTTQVTTSSGDVFAQADAILSSLESPSAASLAANDLLDVTWTVEGDGNGAAAVSTPDWGEW